jgi:hypothetical protein
MADYHIVSTPISSVDGLKNKWTRLSDLIKNENVFLDWFWIGNWLRQIYHLKPILIECVHNEETVGLGVCCEHVKRVSGVTIKQGYLHRCGIEQYDQPWIEFNHFLCATQHQHHCIAAFSNWIRTQDIDEWRIALVDEKSAWLNGISDNITCESTQVPAYLTSLNGNINSLENYISTLSANSRSTLRRAKKYIELTYGDIDYSVIQGQLDESEMNELMLLHKQRWREGTEKSGFHNPSFIDFHRYLQQNPNHPFHIETLVFKAGQLTLGYLYNLVGNKNIKFYLSAINYSDQHNRFQPGLLMHAMAIVHFASEGYTEYDFMGGDSQYKRSLSNHAYHLYDITLRPRTLRNAYLHYLRGIKNRLFSVGRRLGLQ